ncbi:MAG: energy transducer TonB [Mariprofundales bacterium]
MLGHLLLITLLLVAARTVQAPPPPNHAISVQLISPRQLPAAKPKHHPPKHQAKHPSKAKPKPKKMHEPTAVKHHLKHSKAKRKPKPKVKKAVQQPLDFDPFAPEKSSSDAISRKRTKTQPPPTMQDSASLQDGMTQQEIDRYIYRIKRAIENQWRVPAESPHQLIDPEVTLRLHRDGSIAELRISRSSGDSMMDNSLLKAIRAAAPFDLPQDHFGLFKDNHMVFHPLR